MTITDTPIDNGVNTAALLGAREALTAAPEAAEFTWRATCSWVHGTHSRSTVETLLGSRAGAHPPVDVHLRRRPPRVLRVGGPRRDTGRVRARRPRPAASPPASPPSPSYREIQLRTVTATVEGDMNVLGILGADPDVRNGYRDIRVRFDIDADASREDIEALVAQSQKRSAVFDILTNPTDVVVEVG